MSDNLELILPKEGNPYWNELNEKPLKLVLEGEMEENKKQPNEL